MENEILDIRRTFVKPKKIKRPNPAFTELDRKSREAAINGGITYLGPPEFIIEMSGDTESSHIEYKLQCSFCGTVTWMRRRDAKFCTPGCRRLHYDKRKRDRQK